MNSDFSLHNFSLRFSIYISSSSFDFDIYSKNLDVKSSVPDDQTFLTPIEDYITVCIKCFVTIDYLPLAIILTSAHNMRLSSKVFFIRKSLEASKAAIV